jgi:hypothetical protein
MTIVNEKSMTTDEAGEFLHTLLPLRTAAQLTNWLGNNRDETRDAEYRVSFNRIGRTVTYDGDDLMHAATFLSENSTRVRRRSTKPTETPTSSLAQSPRPGLEMALKIVRDLPPGITAEQALMIALNMVQ